MRWKATITYKNNAKVETDFEEIEELHDIVESGPCFFDIVAIAIEPGGGDAERTCVNCKPSPSACMFNPGARINNP